MNTTLNIQPDTSDSLLTEVVLPGIVGPTEFQLRQREKPTPARGQALVRVEATGISFAERSMRRGRYPGQPAFPFVPGYDLVGTVETVGPNVDTSLVGTRVAAATMVGGWATHSIVEARRLVPVPAGVSAANAETVVVNGITAHQMLFRAAKARKGQTILVHGASGGVGTILVQLARHAGIRVIGTASPKNHDALRALGAEPIDYHDADLASRVHELSPGGVDAVFDQLGIASISASFNMLAPGGTLVAYGTAATQHDGSSSVMLEFVQLFARVFAWNAMPNGRRAVFYNFWGGSRMHGYTFFAHQRHDLAAMLNLVADGKITPQIAARFALSAIATAMTLAESHTTSGKIILEP